MGKKNTGTNSRSKGNENQKGITDGKPFCFVPQQTHRFPLPYQFIGPIIQEHFSVCKPFFDSFCQKITDSFIQNVDFSVAPQLFSNSHRLYR